MSLRLRFLHHLGIRVFIIKSFSLTAVRFSVLNNYSTEFYKQYVLQKKKNMCCVFTKI